jgi:hypothetical protein
MFQPWLTRLVLLTAVLLAPHAGAQTEAESGGYEAEIHLTNGSVLVGTVIEQDTESVRLQLKDSASEPLLLPMASIARMVHLQGEPVEVPIEEPVVEPVVEPVEEPVEEPVYPETKPSPVETGRAMGFGFNTAWGLGYGSTVSGVLLGVRSEEAHMDLEPPGFELRIFPADWFSIDVLFKIGSMVFRQAQQQIMWGEFLTSGPYAVLNVYTHIWAKPRPVGNAWIAPSIAPGLAFGTLGSWGPIPLGLHMGFSMRIGVEFSSAEGRFGWGVYLRPGVGAAAPTPGVSQSESYLEGAEVLLELTWCWYAARPWHLADRD